MQADDNLTYMFVQGHTHSRKLLSIYIATLSLNLDQQEVKVKAKAKILMSKRELEEPHSTKYVSTNCIDELHTGNDILYRRRELKFKCFEILAP